MPAPLRRATLRDVARRANVSVSTASLVLNGRPGIATTTRARVWQAAHELRYIADERARELRLGRFRDIAVAMDPALTHDVGEVSRLFGLRLLTTLTSQLRSRGLRIVSSADCSHAAAGILLGNAQARWREDLAVVYAGREETGNAAACLVHDHQAYVNELVAHLQAQGATHLALLREPAPHNYQQIVEDSLRSHHLPLTVIPSEIRSVATSGAATAAVDAGADAIVSLLPFPGAILSALDRRGLRTPEDVLVVVRGEGLLESQTSPQVSSLSMCAQECGELIAAALDRVLVGERGLRLTLPHRLTVRTSSHRFSIV